MTLKEKLIYEIGDNCEHSSYCRKKSCQTENGIFCFVDKQTIENCEKIADELAIGFTEWCLADFYISLQTGIDAKADTMEELLEIYKKEKGL